MLHLLLQIYEVNREDIGKIWVAKHLGRSMKKNFNLKVQEVFKDP